MSRSVVPGVLDTQCGFKFFQRRAVTAALVQCRTTGFAFDVELLSRLQGAGGRIVEIPVEWTDDARSTFSPFRDGAASFGALRQISRMVQS
jgi:dolichyl-phosphate beta-glucosyltransferase